jgi:diguanylate cyclase (GGDEF)-like protein
MRAFVRSTCLVLGVPALFAVVLVVQPGGHHVARSIDDFLQLGGVAFATAAAVRRGVRTSGRLRLSWSLLGCALAAWTAGQVAWTYYEVIANRDTPFPSLADLGYLLFPVLALAALLTRPSAGYAGQGRLRTVLDGLLVALALINVSWVTTLGTVFRAGADSHFAFIIALAYPVSDAILVAVAVVALAHAKGARGALLLVTAGLATLALSDSAFSYLLSTGAYSTGNIVDVGWSVAFLLIARGALLPDAAEHAERLEQPQSIASIAIPYVALFVGLGVSLSRAFGGHRDFLTLVVGTLIVLVLFTRQLLVLVDNRRLVQRVGHQAFHDDLTGLPNRALFMDRAAHALALSGRLQRPVAALFCDLDDFKTVNDTLGHPAGDRLLVLVAERLLDTVRAGDTVARLGGDEFAVLIEDSGDAQRVAAHILDALREPVTLAGRQVPVRASIGIAEIDPAEGVLDVADLLKRADIAMYSAKRSGKGTFEIYTSALSNDDELDLKTDLAHAVGTAEIKVAFQPIFAATGELIMFEGLARWSRNGKPIPPATFIPVAERAGLLAALDGIVLDRCVEQLALLDRAFPTVRMAVNSGIDQLCDPNLPGRVAALLARHGLAASRLVIEVPETHRSDHPEGLLGGLARLRNLGVGLALDDFGVGHSSLSRLHAIPPDIIKIDRSFIAALGGRSHQVNCLAGIIDLAHRIGASVVAEGVEQQHQLETLRALGCDAVQGFLLGMPVSDITPFLTISTNQATPTLLG